MASSQQQKEKRNPRNIVTDLGFVCVFVTETSEPISSYILRPISTSVNCEPLRTHNSPPVHPYSSPTTVTLTVEDTKNEYSPTPRTVYAQRVLQVSRTSFRTLKNSPHTILHLVHRTPFLSTCTILPISLAVSRIRALRDPLFAGEPGSRH